MKENKKIVILGLAVFILIVVSVMILINNKSSEKNVSIDEIIKNSETKILYVENSDKKKCEDCKKIKKYLDRKKINYVLYDANKHKKEEYEKMLQSISINPSDFNYPAIIYIKDGSLYSNIINIKDEKVIDKFFQDNNISNLKR